MTQAAVSYQVKLLEERIGVSLFARVGRGVELTEHGQTLAPAIIRAFDTMRSGFANLRLDSAAVLTISCSVSFAHLWLAPRIGAFQMLRPDLAVRIQAENRLIDFALDNVDVAIRGGDGLWPGVEADVLSRNRILPLCSPAYLERIGGPVAHARDLLTLARLSPDDIWWREWFAAQGIDMQQAGVARPAIALDSQAMEGRSAIAGQGIAILNALMWKNEIEAGQLVEVVPSYVVEDMRYWVVYPPATRNLPKVKIFRDWIMGEFSDLRRQDPDGRFLPPLKQAQIRDGARD